MPSSRRFLGFAVSATTLLALGFGGCAPGITHEKEIKSRSNVCGLAMSPDGKHVAIGISVDQYHPPNALGMFPDGGMMLEVKSTLEVVLTDVTHATPPRTLASLRRDEHEQASLMYWDSTGIVVEFVSSGFRGTSYMKRRRTLRVDSMRGTTTTIAASELSAVRAQWVRFHPGTSAWDDLRRRHVHEDQFQVFLWDPVARIDAKLYEVPMAWDGHPDPLAQSWVEPRRVSRVSGGFLRIWESSAHPDQDSIGIHIETFASRPAEAPREYSLRIFVWAPDTTSQRRGIHGPALPVVDRTLTLAPVTRHVDETIGYKQLRRMLAPFAGHFDDWPRDSVELQFAIALAPLPQEADSIRNTRLYRKQDDGLLVRVPRRLVLTERR